jgi:hypothetical protein
VPPVLVLFGGRRAVVFVFGRRIHREASSANRCGGPWPRLGVAALCSPAPSPSSWPPAARRARMPRIRAGCGSWLETQMDTEGHRWTRSPAPRTANDHEPNSAPPKGNGTQ